MGCSGHQSRRWRARPAAGESGDAQDHHAETQQQLAQLPSGRRGNHLDPWSGYQPVTAALQGQRDESDESGDREPVKKARRAARAEGGLGGASAEDRQVGSAALLKKHDENEKDTDQHVDGVEQIQQHDELPSRSIFNRSNG